MPFLNIRFIQEADLISDAIRVVTFSRWSHTEIETPEGTFIGAHASGGVEERPANYCKPTHERRYALPVSQEQLDLMLAFARSKVGEPYDFGDIANLLFHVDASHSVGRCICSTFVAQVAMAGGVYLLNVLPSYLNLITPEMLHLSPVLMNRCVLDV